jgi:hypothetical protein
MNKYQKWWNGLSPDMRNYLQKQPIWHDRDLYKAMAVGTVIGFLIGVIVGFEWAWRPAVQTFSPVTG